MFQRGPGEGYGAARDEVLAREPGATCRRSDLGGIRHYRIFVHDEDVACGDMSSRGAWGYLDRLNAAQA